MLLADEVKPAEEPPTAEKKDEEEPILELNPAENTDAGHSQSTNHSNMNSVT